MPILSKPSGAARTSVLYITIGALLDVWSGIWYWYLSNHPPEREISWYLCFGFLLTGLVLVVIGMALGQIGRAARNAELPPSEVTPAAVQAEQNAAARAPVIAPAYPAAGSAGSPVASVAAIQPTPYVVESPVVRSNR